MSGFHLFSSKPKLFKLAVFLLVLVGLSIIIGTAYFKIKSAKAQASSPQLSGDTWTFSSNWNIGFSRNYDGKNIVIENGAVVSLDNKRDDAPHQFSSLTIQDGGVLTHNVVNQNGKVGRNDNFAIRWKGFIEIPSNKNALILTSDNGSKITIKNVNTGKEKTSEWFKQGGTADLALYDILPGMNEIEVDYIEGIERASINFKWGLCTANGFCKLPGELVPNSALYLKSDKTAGACGSPTAINGLCGEYFADVFQSNPFPENRGPDFNFTKIDSQINFNWGFGGPISALASAGLDLQLNGDLNLEGGKIDVTGKGYPYLGGKNISDNGAGPLGGRAGKDDSGCDTNWWGGGGGYGGLGRRLAGGTDSYGNMGSSGAWPSPNVPYGDAKNPTDFGSAGAGSYH